tara:strand:- start:1868 stop:3805 length:1938 start_codon:yes stop_codon:yes gene_type:complete
LITKKATYYLFIICIILLPWLNTDIQNEYSISEVRQENISFYEINPCKISIVQFIRNNIESIYQNHYYFRPNDKSPIQCFGRVAGVTVMQKELETQFIISIGTNSLINILFQGLFWVFIFSLVPKNTKLSTSNYKFKNTSILILSYLFTYSIYGESRFYENNLYEFDFSNIRSYLFIFLAYFLISKNLIDVYEERSENLINYIPFIFIFTFIFSGFNFSFLSSIFLYLGLVSYFSREGNSKFNFIYLFLSIWWLINSNGSFYFNIGKLRGFTSSVYEFNANLFWIIFLYLLLKGVYKFYIENKRYFNLDSFVKNLSFSSFFLLFFGITSANIPLINFFNYYFFGLQRYGVESKTPFALDEFGVRVSWRGIFPSSETIGEFYGIVLLFLLFRIVKSDKLRSTDYLGVLSAALGLYLSDNRTTMVLVFVLSIIYLFLIYFPSLFNKKGILILLFLLPFSFISIFLMSSGYEFASNSVIAQAMTFQFDSIYSSYLKLLSNGTESESAFSYIFGFFSSIAFFLNRSEMWGLFFSRFNPTFMELLFGSGPLNFGQLYGEVVVNDPESFLLPHSSILSFIVFLGIIPMVLLFLFLIIQLLNNKRNYEFIIFVIFIFVNLIKNDSLNYTVSFIFYSILYLVLKNKNRLTIFK